MSDDSDDLRHPCQVRRTAVASDNYGTADLAPILYSSACWANCTLSRITTLEFCCATTMLFPSCEVQAEYLRPSRLPAPTAIPC
jgi:hypothetical protein